MNSLDERQIWLDNCSQNSMPLVPLSPPRQFVKCLHSVHYSLAGRVSLGLIVLCLCLTSTTKAAENRDAIVNRLANVEVFAFGGVGFTGAISPGEKDYRLLRSQPAAEADFERLFTIGNSQAKCYALVGLRQLNPEKFKTFSASLRPSKVEVSTMHGCIMRHERMAALVERIQAGDDTK
jgi:hypothetical protein